MASHVAVVIKANTDQSVILGGHDWVRGAVDARSLPPLDKCSNKYVA